MLGGTHAGPGTVLRSTPHISRSSLLLTRVEHSVTVIPISQVTKLVGSGEVTGLRSAVEVGVESPPGPSALAQGPVFPSFAWAIRTSRGLACSLLALAKDSSMFVCWSLPEQVIGIIGKGSSSSRQLGKDMSIHSDCVCRFRRCFHLCSPRCAPQAWCSVSTEEPSRAQTLCVPGVGLWGLGCTLSPTFPFSALPLESLTTK